MSFSGTKIPERIRYIEREILDNQVRNSRSPSTKCFLGGLCAEPDLLPINRTWGRRRPSRETLFNLTRTGIPGTKMPAYCHVGVGCPCRRGRTALLAKRTPPSYDSHTPNLRSPERTHDKERAIACIPAPTVSTLTIIRLQKHSRCFNSVQATMKVQLPVSLLPGKICSF